MNFGFWVLGFSLLTPHLKEIRHYLNSADPCADHTAESGQQKSQKNPQQLIFPPAAEGCHVLGDGFKLPDNRRPKQNLDKGRHVTRPDNRCETGDEY